MRIIITVIVLIETELAVYLVFVRNRIAVSD